MERKAVISCRQKLPNTTYQEDNTEQMPTQDWTIELSVKNIEHEMPIRANDHCVFVFDYVVIMMPEARGRQQGNGIPAFHKAKYQEAREFLEREYRRKKN